METRKLLDSEQKFLMDVELVMRQIEVREITMNEGYYQLLSLYRSHLGEE